MSARKKPLAEWALAHVLEGWKTNAGPLVRKSYKQHGAERELAAKAAALMHGYARALECAADPEATDIV